MDAAGPGLEADHHRVIMPVEREGDDGGRSRKEVEVLPTATRQWVDGRQVSHAKGRHVRGRRERFLVHNTGQCRKMRPCSVYIRFLRNLKKISSISMSSGQ